VGLVVMAGILGLAAVVPRLRRSLTALDPEAGTSHSHRIPRRVANALLVVALQLGDLAVVSVIIGIYPLATIVLARLVLKERMSAVQASGVGLALIATVLLALSTV
jgi:drug/metabolite transporter (DMT)-like permease